MDNNDQWVDEIVAQANWLLGCVQVVLLALCVGGAGYALYKLLIR